MAGLAKAEVAAGVTNNEVVEQTEVEYVRCGTKPDRQPGIVRARRGITAYAELCISGVMRTPGICGVRGATLDPVGPTRTWTPHNQSSSRNASNRSLAWYRQRPLGRSCIFASARSFMPRSASTY